MSVLADAVASLRAYGATAEIVRDDDDSGFAWAELGDLATSLDYWFDNRIGIWVALVSTLPSSALGPFIVAPPPVNLYSPTAFDLHELVLRLLQTESTTP